MTAMSSTSPLRFLLTSVIYISSCFSLHASTSSPIGFSSRILNRNSVHSPFYNPNSTRNDRIRAAVSHSFARYNYLQSLISNSSIATPAWPADGEYVMEYYIGTPPVRTYAILDTASPTTWLQCLPCEKCYNQAQVPLFDPAKSSSYKPIACADLRCQRLNPVRNQCKLEQSCKYKVRYMDGSSTTGDAAEETLHFYTRMENVTVENIVIGCGHNNNYKAGVEGVPGVIGLMTKYQSLVAQMSLGKFAYCFGDPDDSNARGYAMFGEAASITGYATSIVSVERFTYPFYFLNLDGISVDNTRLMIPAGAFKLRTEYPSGFLIDSGKHFTTLNRTAFRVLGAELRDNLQNLKRVVDPNRVFDLCYEMYWVDLMFAPIITLHFRGVDLQLPFKNTWYNVQGNIYCLAMFPTDRASVLGHFQQKNYNVGYDLENNVISFDLTDCSDY